MKNLRGGGMSMGFVERRFGGILFKAELGVHHSWSNVMTRQWGTTVFDRVSTRNNYLEIIWHLLSNISKIPAVDSQNFPKTLGLIA